jgi:hypothetical protein
LTGEEHWKNTADRALELVKKGQVLNSPNSALRGAIPGADPIWGWYNDGAVLNWSAKFFIDALLKKKGLSTPVHVAAGQL